MTKRASARHAVRRDDPVLRDAPVQRRARDAERLRGRVRPPAMRGERRDDAAAFVVGQRAGYDAAELRGDPGRQISPRARVAHRARIAQHVAQLPHVAGPRIRGELFGERRIERQHVAGGLRFLGEHGGDHVAHVGTLRSGGSSNVAPLSR